MTQRRGFCLLIKVLPAILCALLLFAGTVAAEPKTATSGQTDIWQQGENIIKDLYTRIAGISTVLAGLLTAVAAVSAKLSNNQQHVDRAWDWIKRIWICWVIINGAGLIIVYAKTLMHANPQLE